MAIKITKKEKTIEDFNKLSKKHQKEVLDFVTYLKVKEELNATNEILSDENFLKAIIKGDEDFKQGRFKKWAEVREDV